MKIDYWLTRNLKLTIMVTSNKTHKPDYSLTRIVELANQQAVDKRSVKIDCDLEALNYNFKDMCNCISDLEPCHYEHTHKYENRNFLLDVYKIPRYINGQGRQVNVSIYIKLCLDPTVSSIQLYSFHIG